jgi:tetratricopeptide (TPR) repeat protein
MTAPRRLILLLLAAVAVLQLTVALYAEDARLLQRAPNSLNERGRTFLSECAEASGTIDACELAFCQSLYEELQANIAPQSLRSVPLDDRLRILHQRLHAEILVGQYRLEASDIRLAIGRGDFNCLSATALYWDLAREAGVELEIWSLPGHVYLSCPQLATHIIEPARRTWPAEPSVQKIASSRARQVTPTQLIGKFYYNRGVLALERGEYAVGVELLRQSLALDPRDSEARKNLLAGLNNWAADLCRQQHYAEAQALIIQGLAIDGDFAPLVANQRYVRKMLTAP